MPYYAIVEDFKMSMNINLANDPMASNDGNLYNKLLDLLLGRYGVPHDELNGTD